VKRRPFGLTFKHHHLCSTQNARTGNMAGCNYSGRAAAPQKTAAYYWICCDPQLSLSMDDITTVDIHSTPQLTITRDSNWAPDMPRLASLQSLRSSR
jgi:hypothetical protein